MPRYIQNENGKRIAVRLSIKDYNSMRKELSKLRAGRDLCKAILKEPMVTIEMKETHFIMPLIHPN